MRKWIRKHIKRLKSIIFSLLSSLKSFIDMLLGYNTNVQENEYDLEIADYTKDIEINPGLAKAYSYNNRGNAFTKKGDYDKAIADYSRAIEIDPKYTKAYNNRGNAFEKKGNYDKAIADYTKAIEINSKYDIPYYNRGCAFNTKGDYNRAIADFNKAIEINPEFADAYYHRGYSYVRKGKYNQAIIDFSRAIELVPERTGVYNGMGYIAITDFIAAIESDPGFALAYFNRGLFYTKKGDFDRALMYIYNAQNLGYKVDPKFLKKLRELWEDKILRLS